MNFLAYTFNLSCIMIGQEHAATHIVRPPEVDTRHSQSLECTAGHHDRLSRCVSNRLPELRSPVPDFRMEVPRLPLLILLSWHAMKYTHTQLSTAVSCREGMVTMSIKGHTPSCRALHGAPLNRHEAR